MSLVVKGLTKRFGAKVAVNSLDFSMTSSGVFGLIGTNGAGKTTTIRMILGILEADEGSALWNGKKVNRESVSFGYMPEERGIYTKAKVFDQLVYFGMLQQMSKKDAAKSAENWLKRLRISQYKDMVADKLSKGNQQKVQLIATLIHDPKLIFLDEPFSGLDPINTDMFKEVIADLIKKDKYIIMSSHQMATLEEYCSDIVILNEGKTVISGNLREIKKSYGHTRLLLDTEKDISKIAEQCGAVVSLERATETEYKITGDEMAQAFLKKLCETENFPLKYEIREPSLHEIFIEKVGEENA